MRRRLRDGAPSAFIPPQSAEELRAARTNAKRPVVRSTLVMTAQRSHSLREPRTLNEVFIIASDHLYRRLSNTRVRPPQRDLVQVSSAGAASHFGFISRPHFLGSWACICSILLATSGWLCTTCLVMFCTNSSQVLAKSC